MFQERSREESEGGNGKNLHFQPSHVTVMRCPISSLKYPTLMVCERRRQALTLVRQFNAIEFAPKSKGNRQSLGSLVGGLWQGGFLREPCESCGKHCELVFLHGEAAQGGTARSVYLLKASSGLGCVILIAGLRKVYDDHVKHLLCNVQASHFLCGLASMDGTGRSHRCWIG